MQRRWRALAACWWLWAAQAAVGAEADFAARVAQEQERARLLASGQQRLAAGDAKGAREDFEQAASVRHAPDAEVALVRAHMQAGEYRQALRVAAHSSAHLEYPEAAALYDRLLRAGGQSDAAGRTIGSLPYRASEGVRLGPYAVPVDLAPADALTVGTGLLLNGGALALVPLAVLQGARELWLRNGLGHTATARIERVDEMLGMALLSLEPPLAPGRELELSVRPVFAGSAAAVVAYTEYDTSAPAWPELRAGFLKRLPPQFGGPAPGIRLAPNHRGGPVFDSAGRLVGFALATTSELAALIGTERLLAAAGMTLGAPAKTPSGTGLDAVYEAALQAVVQILRRP